MSLNTMRCTTRPMLYGISLRNINVQPVKKLHTSPRFLCLADGGAGFHKPTPFQQKVLVWTKTYASEKDIPERVTRGQMKTAMDKFRVRVSVGMVAMTFIFAAMMALVGRKARNEGQTLTQITLANRAK